MTTSPAIRVWKDWVMSRMLQFYQFPIGNAGARGFGADSDACFALAQNTAQLARRGYGAGAVLWIPDGRFSAGFIGENDYFRQLERSGVAGPQLLDAFTRVAQPSGVRNLVAYLGQNWATGWSSPNGAQSQVLYDDYIAALLRFKTRAGSGSGLTGIARDASNNQTFALAATDAARAEALSTMLTKRRVEAAGLNFMWEGFTAGRPDRSWAFTDADPGWGGGSLAQYENVDDVVANGPGIMSLAASQLGGLNIGPSLLILLGLSSPLADQAAIAVAYHCHVLAGLATVDPIAAKKLDAAFYFRPADPFTQASMDQFINDLNVALT